MKRLPPMLYDRKPSHRQLSVLVAVATHRGGPPSRRALAAFLGVTTEVIADAVRRLRRRRLLTPSGPLVLTAEGTALVLGAPCQGSPEATCDPFEVATCLPPWTTSLPTSAL